MLICLNKLNRELLQMPNRTSGLSLYWKCQLIGWSLASLYWVLMGIIGTDFSLPLAIILFIGDLVIYILPTHLFRLISIKNKWEQWPPKKLVLVIIPSIILLGFVLMLLTIGKNYLAKFYFYTSLNQSFGNYFNSSWLVTWMTGIRLSAIWILAYYLYHYAQAEISANKESARLNLIAKNAQLENLTAKLNPHFFFNSLNNIKALVIENPTAARRAIDLLSTLLRTSLYHHNDALISIEEEMKLVDDYVELERIRFEDRLSFTIEIDAHCEQILILPFSIQTLVENAIKHGISHQAYGGTISLKIYKSERSIKIEVKNPGKWARLDTSDGLGLKNLKERLKLQFSGKAELVIIEENEVVVVSISIPMQ